MLVVRSLRLLLLLFLLLTVVVRGRGDDIVAPVVVFVVSSARLVVAVVSRVVILLAFDGRWRCEASSLTLTETRAPCRVTSCWLGLTRWALDTTSVETVVAGAVVAVVAERGRGDVLRCRRRTDVRRVAVARSSADHARHTGKHILDAAADATSEGSVALRRRCWCGRRRFSRYGSGGDRWWQCSLLIERARFPCARSSSLEQSDELNDRCGEVRSGGVDERSGRDAKRGRVVLCCRHEVGQV